MIEKLFPSQIWTLCRGPDCRQWNGEWSHDSSNQFAFYFLPFSVGCFSLLSQNYHLYRLIPYARNEDKLVQTVGQPCHPRSWPKWTKPWQRRLSSKEVHFRCSSYIIPFEITLSTICRTSGGRSTPVTCPTAPLLPEYNLRTFEKSLLKSKETTLWLQKPQTLMPYTLTH